MLFTPSGKRLERRMSLPSGDLRLDDGRVLTFRGTAPVLGGRIWTAPDGMRVLASMDPTHHGALLHVSISYHSRDPSWNDITQVRAVFFDPDVDAMMVLPKREDYINFHKHTFHIWQTPQEWGLQ